MEAALQIHRDLKFRKAQVITLNLLGYVHLTTANYAVAKVTYLQGLRIARDINYRKGEALLLAALGLLYNQMGDNVMAYDYSQQALSLTQTSIRHPTAKGHALTNLGHALVGMGRLNEAVSVYQQAIHTRQETGEDHLALDSLGGLAHVLWRQKALGKALHYVEEILDEARTQHLRGSQQPLRIYMTCYYILTANKDERAVQILSVAHELLQHQAASINDPERRRFFLEEVPLHQEIVHHFSQLQAGTN